MSFSFPARFAAWLALTSVLAGGCYASHRRAGAIDAGPADAPPRDAGPLPSCDELFARPPDVVNDTPYVDFTCTETTFPLVRSYLEIQTTGAAPILRSCFVVTRAHATSGWTTGQMVSADGPGLSIRVAGPSPDLADEQVLWDARAIDAAGRVYAGRAESVRIGRAIPVVYGEPVKALASLVPSYWSSPGQVNAGIYGHSTSGGERLRLATYGATWLDFAPGPVFLWAFPDDQVRLLIDGDRMTSIGAPASRPGRLYSRATSHLPASCGAKRSRSSTNDCSSSKPARCTRSTESMAPHSGPLRPGCTHSSRTRCFTPMDG
jgi:hypothetical protein